MRPVMLGTLALLTLLLAEACSEELVPSTQLMAVIDAEDELRSDIRRLRVRVRGRAADDDAWGGARLDQEFAQLQWPFRVAIVPASGDARRRVLIEAIAVSQTGEELLLLRVVTGFLEHRTLAVPMLFERLCLRRSCTAEAETCRAGNCESAELDPNKLVELDRYARAPAIDGGQRPPEAAIDGASPVEADATVPETDATTVQQEAGVATSDAGADARAEASDAGDAALARPTLCGTSAASASPGDDCPALVTCGNAVEPCDLATMTCCTAAFTDLGGECTAATSCGLNARASCDGPEDCPGTSVCCFEGGGSSCRPSCELVNTMCHSESDCLEGECQAGSVGGPFWLYWGFCRVP